MVVGDSSQARLTVQRTRRVPPDATVRHFDELSAREQERFLSLVDRPSIGETTPPDCTEDEVVVYTDYYRVRRV